MGIWGKIDIRFRFINCSSTIIFVVLSKVPWHQPRQSPGKSPGKSRRPGKSLGKLRNPGNSPGNNPGKSPGKAPATAPVIAPTKVPSKILVSAPVTPSALVVRRKDPWDFLLNMSSGESDCDMVRNSTRSRLASTHGVRDRDHRFSYNPPWHLAQCSNPLDCLPAA
jgi:hypothetical protein